MSSWAVLLPLEITDPTSLDKSMHRASAAGCPAREDDAKVAGIAGAPGNCEDAVSAELVNSNELWFDATGENIVCGSALPPPVSLIETDTADNL